MKFIRKSHWVKVIAIFLVISFLAEVGSPGVSWALSEGPVQPEFTSFEPVTTTNMVNDFSGDFTYNLPLVEVPGPHGSGYPISLSYHSGTTPEQESSWCGYGFNVNPGVINRGKKGFADDMNGDKVSYIYKMRTSKSVTAQVSVSGDIFSNSNLGVSAGVGIRYNNIRGFGFLANAGVSFFDGVASVGFSVSQDGHSFDASINPMALAKRSLKKTEKRQNEAIAKAEETGDEAALKTATSLRDAAKRKREGIASFGSVSSYSLSDFSSELSVADQPEFAGTSLTAKMGVQLNINLFDGGGRGNIMGTFSEQHTPINRIVKNPTCYGYQYIENAAHGAKDVKTDFSVERDAGYNGRDLFLGIPFNSPDYFSITGEGLGGGFRLHRKQVGTLYPDHKESRTILTSGGFDIGSGLATVVGGSGSGGLQKVDINNWKDDGNTDEKIFKEADSDVEVDAWDECQFRFDNDMGGNVQFISSLDEVPSASVDQAPAHHIKPGLKRYEANVNFSTSLDESDLRRSSFINYSRNKDFEKTISSTTNGDIRYKVYEKNDEVWEGKVDRTHSKIRDAIGEIVTVNESGQRHVYGLPVYSSEETSLSASLKQDLVPYAGLEGTTKTYLDGLSTDEVTKVLPFSRFAAVSGQINNNPYASSYLLTQTTSPDYIDRTFDGPSDDDFGGWTKLDYRQAIGGPDKTDSENWYKWRQPFYGLNAELGDLATRLDDFGTYSSGKHEVYYLKKIETKTHIAYFITNNTTAADFPNVTHEEGATFMTSYLTGSGNDRTDALSAIDDEAASKELASIDDYIDPTKQRLEKLERVVLFAKNSNGELTGFPLKTAHLEYYDETDGTELDQIAWKGLPNSWNPNFVDPETPGNHGGKLMLKRVWFEYEGIRNAKIRPYTFKYQYKAFDPNSELALRYPDIVNHAEGIDEEPAYSEHASDGWGNYRDIETADDRAYNRQKWVDQSKPDPTSKFDPAAWQLKQIKLPSGGEILIQYEQKDYAFVQDRAALGMISLRTDKVHDTDKFYINLEDMGVANDADNTTLEAVKDKINAHLINEKVYFKILYKLIGSSSEPSVDGSCGSEYIDGYANAEAKVENGDLFIEFAQAGKDPHSGNIDKIYLPKKVCLDYLKRQIGNPSLLTNCEEITGFGDDPIKAIEDLFGAIETIANDLGSGSLCATMNDELSYMRLPLFNAKKGGGVRVKRILMYDAGIEAGDESLYGSEYRYENLDGTSSGVATNEPQAFREENAMVTHMQRRLPKELLFKIISGKDKEQGEGPLGESLLPSPSIGYSRIVTHNIHNGKTATGHIVNEYFTAKDYPMEVDYTNVDSERDFAIKPLGVFNAVVDNRWASQGYLFKINNMHGQMKRTATYGGSYNLSASEDVRYLSSQQTFDYYQPDEQVPVMKEDGTIEYKYMGVEDDIAMYMKSVEEKYDNVDLAMDFSLSNTYPVPIPGVSLWPAYSIQENRVRTHSTSRIVKYPVIRKSTTAFQDGIYSHQENKVFSSTTGDPIVTSTSDGYDLEMAIHGFDHEGYYVSYQIPGTHIYDALGSKGKNEGFINSNYNITFDEDNSFTLPDDQLITAGLLKTGDLLRLSDGTNSEIYYVDSFIENKVYINSLSFMDGKSLNTISEFEVIRSGYTNQLKSMVGSVTTYGDDYDLVSLPSPLSGNTMASLTDVVSAQVSTLNEDWGDGYVRDLYDLSIAPGFETGTRGKWRHDASYVYRTDVTGSTASGEFNYSGGIYTSFNGFDFDDHSNNSSEWIETSKVLSYSPNGEPLQEENLAGIRSSAKFGYSENVPELVAQNASLSAVAFTSFEHEDHDFIDETEAHAGSKSLRLGIAAKHRVDELELDDQIKKEGLLVQFWMKPGLNFPDINSQNGLDIYAIESTLEDENVIATDASFTAQAGDWKLFQAHFSGNQFTFDSGAEIEIYFQNFHIGGTWLDDIRIQPYNAEMTTYVYNPDNLRLLTTFDDQHFGLYNQYNAEGQLVRKIIETERGKLTVQETQYNTPWTNKD